MVENKCPFSNRMQNATIVYHEAGTSCISGSSQGEGSKIKAHFLTTSRTLGTIVNMKPTLSVLQ